MTAPLCAHGHVWSHQFGNDWTPDTGTPCDCGKKQWGVHVVTVREHVWQFYMNGSFCTRCGAQAGSGQACR